MGYGELFSLQIRSVKAHIPWKGLYFQSKWENMDQFIKLKTVIKDTKIVILCSSEDQHYSFISNMTD